MSIITAKYGEWDSPLKSDIAVSSSVTLGRMYFDPSDGNSLFWDELRPAEEGLTTLLSQNVGYGYGVTPERWTPMGGADVYDMVHEYGGAAYAVNNGVVYYSNLTDNCIYKVTKDDKIPTRLTQLSATENPSNKSPYRYADFDFSNDGGWLFCIREDHYTTTVDKDGQCRNTIVAINVNDGTDQFVFAEGNDFYSSPRVSPDGKQLAWITWVHNNMPWDETELWVANFEFVDGELKVSGQKKVAGKAKLNLMEPRWTADGGLLVISDPEGWWNLHIVENLSTTSPSIKCVYKDTTQELGGPCWEFGNGSYSPNPKDADQVFVLYGGKAALLTLSTGVCKSYTLDSDQHAVSCLFSPDGQYVFLKVDNPKKPSVILRIELSTDKRLDFHHSAELSDEIGEDDLSSPEAHEFEFDTDYGKDKAYGFYYAPKNSKYEAPAGTLPPVLLKIHGGPTASASLAMDLQKQYFTSRGIAIFDLNYRGSTGYGTAYRNRLKTKWGVYDIEDSLKGALSLVDKGLVDRNALLISGGSSGGYTTLACLTFDTNVPRVFAAGTSYYGISDLEILAKHTHKFESHYCDEMIAPYPEHVEVYHARSPIYHVDQFGSPCCFFQGLLDKVVPPEQSQEMYEAILEKDVTCAYVTFDDEEHGFKKAENKQKALDGEFYFYSKVLGFEAVDQGIEIPIENLPEETKSKSKRQRKK